MAKNFASNFSKNKCRLYTLFVLKLLFFFRDITVAHEGTPDRHRYLLVEKFSAITARVAIPKRIFDTNMVPFFIRRNSAIANNRVCEITQGRPGGRWMRIQV